MIQTEYIHVGPLQVTWFWTVLFFWVLFIGNTIKQIVNKHYLQFFIVNKTYSIITPLEFGYLKRKRGTQRTNTQSKDGIFHLESTTLSFSAFFFFFTYKFQGASLVFKICIYRNYLLVTSDPLVVPKLVYLIVTSQAPGNWGVSFFCLSYIFLSLLV